MSRRDKGARPTAAGLGVLTETEPSVAFLGFRLFPQARLLFAGEEAVDVGSRAFAMLLALVEANGGLLTKKALHRRVWPDTVVTDHNVDIQIAALRKALGEVVRTEAGRGYRLAATVRSLPASPVQTTNLPTPVSPLVGREHEVARLQRLVAAHRLVTLTGAGGIGKTRLGLEAARRALPEFADGAWVAEFGPVAEPELVAGTIARALGMEPGFDRSATDQLATVLHRKHLLLLLDNCEHLIEAVAHTAQALLRGAPKLHILATSQQPISAEGEHLYVVQPLSVPPTGLGEASQALAHSAVQLFVARARAAYARFAWDDRTAAAASNICRHLDGIPLAIELAAACVETMAVDVLAKRLDDRFRALKRGPHTALPRHQTLRAALDWSYGLLTEPERAVLRRLAIFAGGFTLDSAGAVAAGDAIEAAEAADHVTDLVRKSLVTFEARGAASRYRLLETTQAYAREKLAESGEFDAVARRHAEHYRQWMEQAQAGWQSTPAPELVAQYGAEVDNIRAALDWALVPGGDAELGVALAAASIPLWTLLSILGECRDLVDRALSHLDKGSNQQTRHEMVLQAALARSSLWAQGPIGATCSASERALELAERMEDTDYQLRALYIVWGYRLRIGEYRTCLAVAKRFGQIADRRTDVPAALTAARLEGVSLFYLGDPSGAQAVLQRVLNNDDPDMRRAFVARFCTDQRVVAFVYLARSLWLQGLPDQAARKVAAAVEEARALNHANSLCLALCDGACGVAAMSGDLQAVEEYAEILIDCAEQHGLGMRLADGLGFKGWMAAKRGDAAAGIRLLRRALDGFGGSRIRLRHTIFLEALTEALAAAGRIDEALAVIREAREETSRDEGRWCFAELLRLRGEITLREGLPSAALAAEKDFLEALDVARRQGARSWQLRAATSLARLWRSQGRDSKARHVLVPIYDEFTEGFETADLKAARALVEVLRVEGRGPSLADGCYQ